MGSAKVTLFIVAAMVAAVTASFDIPISSSEAQEEIGLTYPKPILPQGNTTKLGMASTPTAVYVFALGKDRLLYYKYQTTSSDKPSEWTEWMKLSDNDTVTWDSDPAVGVNRDGRIEIFVRQVVGLDTWHIHQVDPTDPESFSTPRGPACICNYPPCPECLHNATATAAYWNYQPVFPTSDHTVTLHPTTGALQMWYRGFDGALYLVEQEEPGNPRKYLRPKRMDVIIE